MTNGSAVDTSQAVPEHVQEVRRDVAIARALTLVEKVESGELAGEQAQDAIAQATALLRSAKGASS